MEYIALTQTDFFRQIEDSCSHESLSPAYIDFTDRIIRLCMDESDQYLAVLTLAYTEMELRFHHRLQVPETDGMPHLYIRKAIAFVRRIRKHIAASAPPFPPPDTNQEIPPPATVMRWTGKASDLVEILYGMAEMGCINDGEITVGELASFFYSLFNVEAKDCYRIYSDLKLRKNKSRTYFLDKMQEKLNRRMDMDEERDKMRK